MNTLAIALAILLAMVLGVAASVFGFLWTLANANRIRRRFHINLGPYHACVLDFVSRKFPDLFWERSHRASWLKGVKWHAFNQRVWGYVDQHSAVQGQTVRVFLSADLDLAQVEGQLIAFHFRGLGNEQEVWRSEVDTVRLQTLNHGAASIGTWWTPWCSLRVGEDWRSGFYRFDFIESNGKTTQDVAYLVVRNAAMSGDILVKIPTATYQAYNSFGGHSVYNNHHTGKGEGRAGQIMSFDRPTPITRFRWYDQYFIHWIEQFAVEHGKTVDYATNYDVHANPALSATYPLMIMTGHDEYWSKEEFDNVYRRIFELGKNTMFLAANTAFWQIRYADAHQTDAGGRYERQFVCYKSTLDPVQYRFPAGQEKLASQYLSTRFRDNERRPEVMMLGVAYGRLYDGAWNRKFPYHVADNSLPFFANTGYQTGDFVADIIGHEWDARQPHWPDSDCERMWHGERSCIPFLPLEDIKVVLTGTARGKDGVDRIAEAVYFESRAGAKVFSAGTIAWALGLSKPGTEQSSFRQLNRNLMLYFLDSLVTESAG